MNFLLVDTSYFIFYRFYATLQWYKCANSDEYMVLKDEDYDWSENIIFWEKFKKMFIETIDKMRKKLDIDTVVFARDCPRSDIWRLLFFPGYKKGRSSHKNIGSIFKKSYSDIICDIVDDNKYFQIKSDKLEGDDIIALSVDYIDNKYKDSNIYIISSDHDLLQLIRPHVQLLDAKMKSYNNKSYGSKKKDIYLKCILGDSSDCIPKVFNRVGEQTALKIYDNMELLLERFYKTPGSFQQFVLNNTLINFDNIPQHLKAECIPKLVF